jgi:hypothetical protein
MKHLKQNVAPGEKFQAIRGAFGLLGRSRFAKLPVSSGVEKSSQIVVEHKSRSN